jgi:predicted ribosome quality control (RQC) complex YloA/Tae2 family protein
MTFDTLALLAVRDELRATVLGGRVQHVHHPDELALAIELYAHGERRWVYCSAHPEQARVHLAGSRPPRRLDTVTPLLLLLRKYVVDGRLEAVEQLPLERVLRLDFSNTLPDGQRARTSLLIEVLGRQANVILVDEDGAVLEALRRVSAEGGRRRAILPRQRYQPPPAQERLDPRAIELADLERAAARWEPGRPVADLLVREVGACSPLLAREVVYRAHARCDAAVGEADWARVCAALRELWADALAGRATPSLAYQDGQMVAYAPYLLQSFADVRPAERMSAVLEAWFGRPATDPDAARRTALRQALQGAQDRLRAKLHSLERSLAPAEEVERLRRAGELILAFAAQIAPRQRELVVPGDAGVIELDPALTPVRNAQRYFAQYAKAKRAAAQVPAMAHEAEQQLRYLDEALTHLELARSPRALDELAAEWAELGYVRPAKASGGRAGRGGQAPRARSAGAASLGGRGYDRLLVDGFEVLVGRSGRGNDALLGPVSQPDDLWLHARGVPGAHVLLRTGGRSVPEPVLRRAASLAAAHSQARTAGSVAVDYTKRRFVERIKGAPPGLVTYRHERTLHVPPDVQAGSIY